MTATGVENITLRLTRIWDSVTLDVLLASVVLSMPIWWLFVRLAPPLDVIVGLGVLGASALRILFRAPRILSFPRRERVRCRPFGPSSVKVANLTAILGWGLFQVWLVVAFFRSPSLVALSSLAVLTGVTVICVFAWLVSPARQHALSRLAVLVCAVFTAMMGLSFTGLPLPGDFSGRVASLTSVLLVAYLAFSRRSAVAIVLYAALLGVAALNGSRAAFVAIVLAGLILISLKPGVFWARRLLLLAALILTSVTLLFASPLQDRMSESGSTINFVASTHGEDWDSTHSEPGVKDLPARDLEEVSNCILLESRALQRSELVCLPAWVPVTELPISSVNSTGRTSFWMVTWESWRSSPFIGLGLGSSSDLMQRVFDGKVDHPHSEPLRLVHDTGLVGLVFASIGLLGTLWSLFNRFLLNRSLWALSALICWSSLAVVGLIENFLVFPWIVLPAALLLGFGLRQQKSVADSLKHERRVA